VGTSSPSSFLSREGDWFNGSVDCGVVGLSISAIFQFDCGVVGLSISAIIHIYNIIMKVSEALLFANFLRTPATYSPARNNSKYFIPLSPPNRKA